MGFSALLNGEFAKAGGWLSRAKRLLDGHPDCVENGYLLLLEGYRAFHEGDTVSAHATFVQATAIGERFGEKDLTTLGLKGQGRALIRQGEIARGVACAADDAVDVFQGAQRVERGGLQGREAAAAAAMRIHNRQIGS